MVGTAGGTSYGYDKAGKPFLTKEPKLLLNDDKAGKPEGIHLMIGRRPVAAFGNSDGDKQMLEYTKAGAGTRLAMLVMHDDATREYAYGPAQKLPDTKVGTFTQALYDQAMKQGWIVISMKNDWKQDLRVRSLKERSISIVKRVGSLLLALALLPGCAMGYKKDEAATQAAGQLHDRAG